MRHGAAARSAWSLILILAGRAIASADPLATASPNIRCTHPVLTDALARGYELSPMFSRLVDGLNASDVIVYIEAGKCAFGRLNACLQHWLVKSGDHRYLRITVNPTIGEDRVLTSLAHELQHALEVATDPGIVDTKTMAEHFARIRIACGNGRSDCYETDAAVAVGRILSEELQRASSKQAPKPRRRAAHAPSQAPVPSPSCANGARARVRTWSADLNAAVTLGCRGSRTFQLIVARIDASSGVVYVNWARQGSLPAGIEAAVLGDPSRAADGTRYLHVRVRRGSTGEYLSSIIAHELQHALEVLEDSALVTAAAVEERFARDARGLGGHVFETAAALRIGRTVYDELRRNP